VGEPGEREEGIFEVARQTRAVLQVFSRLALSVEQVLYSLDEVVAMGEEELEKLDV
jgi:hypothetical protein